MFTHASKVRHQSLSRRGVVLIARVLVTQIDCLGQRMVACH